MKFTTTAFALSGAVLASAAAIDTRGGAPDNYCPVETKKVRITYVETKVFKKIHTITKEEVEKCAKAPYDPKQVYSYLKDHKYPTYKPTSTKGGVYPTGTWYGNGTHSHTAGPTGGPAPTGATTKLPEPTDTPTPPPADRGCSSPAVRVEWRNLNNGQRDAYISAVRCMINTPSSNSRFRGSKNLHEDFASLHQQLADEIHSTGYFLAYHRFMIDAYYKVMRQQCGYTGPAVWWDETRDAGDFGNAPLFTSRWFGTLRASDGNGFCVDDAGWGSYDANVGPGYEYDFKHCVARNLQDNYSANNHQGTIDSCRSAGNYDDFRKCNEGTYHAWGHFAVGSSMQDAIASPVDPVFYLHHGYVDRQYLDWQNDAEHRKWEIGGGKYGGGDVTPEDRFTAYGLVPDVTAADVLDAAGDYLCYRYDY